MDGLKVIFAFAVIMTALISTIVLTVIGKLPNDMSITILSAAMGAAVSYLFTMRRNGTAEE